MKLEKWKNKWKEWSNLRKWQIWKLKLIDARLYFVSIFVGLLTGLVAVPYHYLLWYFFDVRKTFFTAHYPWYWHVLLFFILWGILIFVASLVKRMPLIAGGGIPQTRAANNGRIRYEHPFKELVAKFCGGVLALSAGLSLGREGPSVQIGSYIGTLISRWGHILRGERKQLLAAGAGAGLSAAFAAPLSSSLLVIESIERFDAPKTAITTLLAGVVAGGVASWMFPTTPYHLISAVVPGLSFIRQVELYIIFAALMAVIAKFYSLIVPFFQERIPAMKLSIPVKMLYLLIIAYAISLTETNLTGGGEQFLMMQGMNGTHDIRWLTIMMLIHFVFTLFSLSSGLPGGSFIPTLVTGGLLGQIFGLVLVQRGWIGYENVSYMMLIGMVAFLVAVVRTPLTAIVLITEITGHFEVFYPSIVVGGLTYYFTELLQIKPYNVLLYDRMFRSHNPESSEEAGARYHLFVEIMDGSYFDGKEVDTLALPNHCIIRSIHRNRKNLLPQGQTPVHQVEIEMDAQDIDLKEMLADFAKKQPELVAMGRKVPYDWTIYYLRKKALSEKITKEELAWILLNFNQKRGYYQLRGEEEEEKKNRLEDFYALKVVEVEQTDDKKGKDIWYNVHLENGWIYRRSSNVPLDWKDKIKEFIVTTELNEDGTPKVDKDGCVKRSFRMPKEDDWKLLKKKTAADIERSHKTIGCYIYDTLLQSPQQKNKRKISPNN